jgi:hypothetical protein
LPAHRFDHGFAQPPLRQLPGRKRR